VIQTVAHYNVDGIQGGREGLPVSVEVFNELTENLSAETLDDILPPTARYSDSSDTNHMGLRAYQVHSGPHF